MAGPFGIGFSGFSPWQVKSGTTDTITPLSAYPNVEVVNLTVTGTATFSATVSAVTFLAGDGTVAAPAYSYTSDPDTGAYRPAANTYAVSAGGTRALQLSSTLTLFGHDAFKAGSGTLSIAIGVQALGFVGPTTGASNIAIGNAALYSNTSGDNSVAIGTTALWQQTSPRYQVAIGLSAGGGQTTSVGRNVFIGKDAGYLVTSGAENATGDRSVIIGYDARPAANAETNEIVIGNEARGAGSNTTTLGNSSTTLCVLNGAVGIGASDALFSRDAADIIAQRRGTNAQSFSIYNTFTDASNYERVRFRWLTNIFDVMSEAAGTGTARQIRLVGDTASPISFFVGAAPSITATVDLGTASLGWRALYLDGGTVTTSRPPIVMTQIWNDAGVTFKAFTISITSTASAAASLIAEWSVGGSAMFSVTKGGTLTLAGSIDCNSGDSRFGNGTTDPIIFLGHSGTSGSIAIYALTGFPKIAFTGTTNAENGHDAWIRRQAAATIYLGDANAAVPVAQTFGVQGSRGGTDTDVAGANLTIQSGIGTGAAAASSIAFQTPTVGASSSTAQTMATRFTVATAGLTATVPLTLTGGTVTVSTPPLVMTQTWNDAGVTFKAFTIAITSTASAAGSLIAEWSVGGSPVFTVGKSGHLLVGAGDASLPSLSFVGDPNTGLFNEAADFIGFAVGGARLMNLGTRGLFMVARLAEAKGSDVVAANDLTLGLEGNFFTVTGNTQINGIATANWQSGAVITLTFTGTPTVKHNTAAGGGFASLLLAGSADFSATANDTLTLRYNGTTWQEMCRTVI